MVCKTKKHREMAVLFWMAINSNHLSDLNAPGPVKSLPALVFYLFFFVTLFPLPLVVSGSHFHDASPYSRQATHSTLLRPERLAAYRAWSAL